MPEAYTDSKSGVDSSQKYKPRSSLSTVTPVTPIHKPKPQLDSFWEKYSEFKKPQISPSTFAKDFTKPGLTQNSTKVGVIHELPLRKNQGFSHILRKSYKHRNHIAKLPTRSLDEASVIRDYLLANLTPDAAKRCLTQLKACCNWAMEQGLIDANPFAAMKIKTPKDATNASM